MSAGNNKDGGSGDGDDNDRNNLKIVFNTNIDSGANRSRSTSPQVVEQMDTGAPSLPPTSPSHSERATSSSQGSNDEDMEVNDIASEENRDRVYQCGRVSSDAPRSTDSDGSSDSAEDPCLCINGSVSEKKKPAVLQIRKPKHNWFVIKEVLKREAGGFKHPTTFTKRFYGSLHAVQRLELMYKLEKHDGCVNCINFSQDGSRLLSSSDDRYVTIWNWIEGKSLCYFYSGHSSNVFQCKYLDSANTQIVTCSRDGQVRLSVGSPDGSFETKRLLATHRKACHKISIVREEPDIVLSAGADGVVYEIDTRTNDSPSQFTVKERGKKVSLYSINCNPRLKEEFIVSGEDYFVRSYDRRYIKGNGDACTKYYPDYFKNPDLVYVTCAVYNYNGTEILGSYNDDDIYLFDRKNPGSNYVHRYEGHRNAETVKGVNFFGPESEYIVSGSDCGHVFIWDKNTEAIVQWKRADEEGVVNCLEPHPKIPVLATSGLDHDVKIWVPSCETEPSMEGLDKTVIHNWQRRSSRQISRSRFQRSIDETLGIFLRQMRYVNPRQSLSLQFFLNGRPSSPVTFSPDTSAASSTSSSDEADY